MNRIRLYLLSMTFVACVPGLVQAQNPGWSVNAGAFSEQMTIIGQLFVDGVQSSDTNDLVAAFVGGEVRGVASPLANGFVFLTIFANTDGEALTFRAFDASANGDGAVIDLVGQLVFVSGCGQGTPSRPFRLSNTYGTGASWAAPEASQFGETMSLVAQLLGPGPYQKVAAFIGGELRGLATGDLTGNFTLNIYDDALPSDCPQVIFRAYGDGEEAPVDNVIPFQSGVHGTAGDPVTLLGQALLPVELVSFDGLVDGRKVILSWQTASETNNAGFEIQLLRDAQRYDEMRLENASTLPWEGLIFVEGHGTTGKPQRYHYTISQLEAGQYRFRLRQIDYDGTFAYSPEVELAVELPQTHLLTQAYPNPATNGAFFSLQVRQPQQIQVTLHDVLGREVAVLYEGEMRAGLGHRFEIDGQTLPSGLYIYRVLGERFTESQTVLLQ